MRQARTYLAALALSLSAAPASAVEGEADGALAGYEVCMARAVAHFETALARQEGAAARARLALVTQDRAEFCGTEAVAACDGLADPGACQLALAERQSALRAELLATLPEPSEVVEGRAGEADAPRLEDALYPRLWAVAHGRSAGEDCAGSEGLMAAWCTTRQANVKLGEAILLWQVARAFGAAEGAVETGWIGPPPPVRPVQRPEIAR